MSADGHALQKQWTRGIVGFLALAVVLHLVRALQDFPMWCDETMLAANLLDRNWTELAHPLDYRQVCPLGFLALEWLAVRIFGFSELSLRLIPMICAIGERSAFLSARAMDSRPRDGGDVRGGCDLLSFRAVDTLRRRGQAL